MKLKGYQQASLDTLQRFLEEARITGPKLAHEKITSEPEVAARLRGYRSSYKPISALPSVPYVCLRLPTGGGKTILAAQAITVAKNAWLEKDYPLVLWLVPTNTIRTQTAEALKNPRHPYRQVLDTAFEGRVRVFDIGDFTEITPHDLRANLCVVVGTIQTLRVTNTDGRKVYAHHEMLEPHFSSIPPNTPGLERDEDGPNKHNIRFSFANLLHLHRPLVMMDEAHKAGSDLSKEIYERINPAALIEFTATPKGFNNILHSVTAQELKDEDMIKMPVVLDEAETWQGAVNAAILKRAELQEHANRDREGYIRPIVLFQAQKKDEEVTVEVLRDHLIQNEGIDAAKIAIATGAQRELDGINLFDPSCPIEYVITIEALKEGWDCSFAYVFCSVANIRNATDAEQLLGRVLRMPYAKKRKEAALNKSYARLVSKAFSEAAHTLRDKLVEMGFEEHEAEANIEGEQTKLGGEIFSYSPRPGPELKFEIGTTAEEAKMIEAAAPGKVTMAPMGDGKAVFQVTGFLKPREKAALLSSLPARLYGAFQEKIAAYEAENAHMLAPAQRGEIFTVPRLMAHVQGELVFGDTDVFMENHEWSLADYPARLEPNEFSILETSDSFEIDLDGNRLVITNADSAQASLLDINVEGWTQGGLVQWLDRKVRDPWISQPVLLAWLNDLITYLIRDRDLPLAQLMRCKFILARKLSEKIQGCRQAERKKIYQLNLLAPGARVEISFDHGFSFSDDLYAGVLRYRGGKFKFNKHFMGPDEVPAFDGVVGGEEEQCAFVIDALPEVKYWTRNVARHPNSFWLPTSTDRFFPDFIALMKDGRLLVVEYKGADRAAEESRDSREKELIGQTWAKASAGKAVFVMATMRDSNPSEIRAQIKSALNGSNT
jgi:type III restriction enzyme